ncbi:cyclomaltodextrinase [Jatrophihabitans endophyticus]|uniref:Cyclomaltodextrinase n=1 Tax=Jatrophihabitans endophyticus TaxID=1206085 RepID=A0A1M5QA15_9ACTN|nr:alpha-amylase family glycosyl hydrolase [Jatrophihabitans endophyticus]SHH11024.1 cyclomaltodextrinase [Jatrophihabitans endophyticus]
MSNDAAGDADTTPGAREPGWVEHAIWWHVYPLGLVGADTTGRDRTPAPRLDRLTRWLDHAVTLGVNGLALGPVFDSATHGYDTVDHFDLDPRLGDDAAFDRLVTAAHDRGIRLMLDGVFNHVAAGFGHDDWLRRSRDGRPRTFEGHGALLALDHDNPDVADHVATVMTHWLDRGADAWRLDAAYAVPAEFWAAVLPRVRAAHPDVYVVGEMLHGDYADYVRRSGVDAVTQYELWKAVWSSLSERNFFELDWTLRRHDGFLDTFVPWTFVGNHDVTRIASRIADARHRPHAAVLLLTLGGTPAVYYGDELGLQAVKEERAGGDDAIRPAFPDSPEAVPELGGDPDVLRVHQEMIGLRRRHPWLHRARSEPVSLTNETLVLRLTGGPDDGVLVVALNLADEPLRVEHDGAPAAGTAERADGGWTVPGHGWVVLD